jgi:cell division protein FtsB
VAKQTRSRAALPSRTTPAPQVGRATLTARAAILAVALASVALALALPFKIWVAQRSQIHSLAAQTRSTEQRITQLQRERARWHDPAFIEQQARIRLHYARPGETTYVVLDRPKQKAPAVTPTQQPTLTGPWYSQLWQSTVAAGTATP